MKRDILETVVKVVVAALTITTTSCMGHGPF